MNPLNELPETSKRIYQSDLKIAVQSALSAALCLGLPAGLIFWLIILQKWAPSTLSNGLLNFFRDNATPPVILEMLGAFGWGLLLSKISGYRQWWWVCAAIMAGVRVGDYALYNGFLDQWVQGHALADISLHIRFALILSITVLCVTMNAGLLLGLILLNWKASLILAASAGIVSVSTVLVTFMFLDGLGIRVGAGNIAMPKVAAISTMTAALAAGAMLGVIFNRYVKAGTQIGAE